MTTKFVRDVTPHITFENALAWDAEDEKFSWLDYNILDAIDWDARRDNGYYDQRKDAAVNWIEVRLQKLIDTNIASWAEYRLAHPAH
jgi:hypothetical protein